MGLRQDESSRINEQVDKILDITKRRGNPSNLAEDLNNREVNPEGQGSGSIAEQEGKGSNVVQGPWANRVGSVDKLQKNKGRLNFLKKKGPLAFIGTTVIAGGFGLVTFFSPGILIIHAKETLTQKFNAQLASMELRTNKMLKTKIDKTTAGYCGKIEVLCRFSTMSSKQVASFKEAGIEVVGEKSALSLGRTKPSGFVYEGKAISPGEFMNTYISDFKFRSAVRKAYTPKWAGYVDDIYKRIARVLRITKKQILSGNTEDDVAKSLQKEVNNAGNKKITKVSEKDTDPETGKNYTAKEVEAINEAADEALASAEKATADGAESAIDEATTASAGAMKKAALKASVSIAGGVDFACSLYTMTKAVAFMAKTTRNLQLIVYANEFLKTADQIKAGKADPVIVSGLGKILTTVTTSEDGSMKSATDSFGYKYAAYGDIGKMTTSSSRFLTGGGLVGKLSSVTKYINDKLKGTPDKTCGILNNSLVQLGTIGVGALMWALNFSPAAPILTWANAAKLASVMVFFAAAYYLPGLLANAIAGVLVDKNTVGEASGDAITSGSSSMMARIANAGGNAPLLPSQAVEYAKLTKEVAAGYANDERISSNPFDATSNYTFMGRIVDRLLPYTSKMSSLTGIFSSISSVTTSSLAYAISPNASADSEPTEEEFTMCQDKEYTELGVATDPFCNIRYGITENVLESATPIEVAEYLLDIKIPGAPEPSKQYIDVTGEPESDYKDFINNCINRNYEEHPLVKSLEYSHSDPNGIGGNEGASECIFNESHSVVNHDFLESCATSFPAPNPSPGEVYLTSWLTTGTATCTRADGTTYTAKNYYYRYMGNAYLYMYYVDKRVDSGMDGV